MIKLKNTNDAIDFGERATLNQIRKIETYKVRFRTKFDKAVESQDYESAVKYSHAVQMMRETICAYNQDPAYKVVKQYIKELSNG